MQRLHDPKALTDSLELDYVDRPRPLHRWLTRITWAAGGVAMVYVAWLLWPTHHAALQAGPVSRPHAMFQSECSQCHAEAFAPATRLLPGHSGALSTPDQTCLQCHPGPAHNSLVQADNCASCHKEHRGETLLARPSDVHCTGCHAQLKDQYGSDCRFANVSSFAAHPEFALWRTAKEQPVDPGNVEFSHHKHLGLRVEDNLKRIEPEVRKLTEMQCAYCHQPERGVGSPEAGIASQGVGMRGRYMQPIRFDQHCRQCHPLLLPVKVGQVPETLKPKLLDFLKEPVAHPLKGQTAWNVRAAVRERYLKFAQNNAGVLNLPGVPIEQWMVLPGLQRRGEPATQGQIDWVNDQWKMAEELIFDKSAGCAHCHAGVSNKKDRQADGLPDFGQPRIPERWLQHSVFDHQAHRMVKCMSCHEGAPTSKTRADVLLPKLATCQSCHQAQTGFAPAGCLECHTFHHRSAAPAWEGKMTIQDCTGPGGGR